jgi:uncharacterized protein YodC (DUF2158 family)
MKTFNKGTQVIFKSGGPQMTVEDVRSDGKLWCSWMKGDEKDGEWFEPETLDPYKGDYPTMTNPIY